MSNSDKIILSLYDYSGNWSKPYQDAGYTVIRYDKKLDGGDVRILKYCKGLKIYGILAAPPCEKSSKMRGKIPTYFELLEFLSHVDLVMRLVVVYRPKFWALENPPGQISYYLGKHRYSFQPYWFGDEHTKQTYLWGKFHRPIVGRSDFYKSGMKSLVLNSSSYEEKSATPLGFSRAFFAVNQ